MGKKKSLAETHPELAKQWHPTKNGDLTPEDVTAGSEKKVWWFLPYDDPVTGKHFEFEWKASVNRRGKGCPYFRGRAVWKGFNDLLTIRPDLAREWHPTKNGDLTPEDVTAGTNKEVWWYLPYDDPNTRRHFDFEWKAKVNSRSRKNGVGCPYTAGKSAWPGFNDLATTHPELAKEWHPVKNGDLTPEKVTAGCSKKVWWCLPYDDPNTGRHFDFEWKASVSNRARHKNKCPYLTGRTAWPGFNDLATTHPELAKEWHPVKNSGLTPEKVTAGCNKKVWWYLPYDDPNTGRHFDFEWKASVSSRAINGINNPYLSGQAVWPGFNDLATTHPELAREWHPTKNGSLTPEKVSDGCNTKVWWFLSYNDQNTGEHFDYEWKASIVNRTVHGTGCPFLSQSYGEQHVLNYLSSRNRTCIYEKSFSDLKGIGNRPLTYDFYVEGTNILVEFHGRQHYEAIDYFGGRTQLKIQKEHDVRKREYAKKNGYRLIEISYKYDTYEKVAAYLDKHLLPLLKKNLPASA